MNNWLSSEWNQVTSGANTAPTPQVNSSPGTAAPPPTWKAPDVSHPGHLQVNTSDLTTASDVIKAHVPELDAAVQAVNEQLSAFTSLSGWTAAEQMRSRLEALVQQCAALAQERSDVQTKAALDLSASADLYREKEAATTKAVKNLGSAVNVGSSPSSSVRQAEQHARGAGWEGQVTR